MVDFSKSPVELTAITSRNAIESPLLRLPAELKNAIYGYVLGYGTYVALTFGTRPVLLPSRRNYLALFATCRQIYVEAALLPFRHYNLCASTLGLERVCLELCPVQRSAIRTLGLTACDQVFTFDASDWEERGYASLTALFPNLQNVLVGGYDHLDDAYDGSGYHHKETLPVAERAQWNAFAEWVQKDIGGDVMVSFQWWVIF